MMHAGGASEPALEVALDAALDMWGLQALGSDSPYTDQYFVLYAEMELPAKNALSVARKRVKAYLHLSEDSAHATRAVTQPKVVPKPKVVSKPNAGRKPRAGRKPTTVSHPNSVRKPTAVIPREAVRKSVRVRKVRVVA